MFVLFVDMKLKPGVQPELEKTYTETFRPAISQQEGFRGVELLRPNKAGGDWRLSIAFESRELQQVVWPQLQSYFVDFSVNDYTSV
jgi:heme-degrading monooxygenase HmoA